MIGETFEVEGKSYVIQKPFTLGDKQRLNKLQNKFNALTKQKLTDEALIQENNMLANENDEIMADLLMKILGLSEDQIAELEYPGEVGAVFEEMIKQVAVPKKKLEKPSGLHSSPEIPVYQKY